MNPCGSVKGSIEMISDRMNESLNGQINAELYSSYLYASMSAYAAHLSLKGAANWFFVQVQEEMVHAQKLYNYILSQGNRVLLAAIDAPPSDFGSIGAAFDAVLEHERKVTSLINNLVTVAAEESDRATAVLLDWFVTEQVEEEESAKDVIDRLKLAGETGPGLFMIDTELAARVFVPPSRNQNT